MESIPIRGKTRHETGKMYPRMSALIHGWGKHPWIINFHGWGIRYLYFVNAKTSVVGAQLEGVLVLKRR